VECNGLSDFFLPDTIIHGLSAYCARGRKEEIDILWGGGIPVGGGGYGM